MSARVFGLMCVAIASCVTACGDEGSGDPAAAAACHGFLDLVCGRATTCAGGGDASACKREAQRAFPGGNTCNDADAVRSPAEFSTCTATIAGWSCDELLANLPSGNLPAACRNQILFR
jgi:hypothetical protein